MATVWCGLEWCRKNFLLGGFPFAALEHSQYQSIVVIQIADVSGEYGLGFVMIVVGACAADFIVGRTKSPDERESSKSAFLWRLTRGCVGVCFFVSLLGYGAYRLSQAPLRLSLNGPSRTIALVQGATDLSDVERPPIERAFEECRAISVDHGEEVDVVVWPESVCALRWAYLEPGYEPSEWQGQPRELIEKTVQQARSTLSQPLIDLAIASRAPLLLNLPVLDYRPGAIRSTCPTNSVLFVDPVKGIGARYDKMKLAPFIECDPATFITNRDIFFRSQFRPGNRATAFPIPKKSKQNYNQVLDIAPLSRGKFVAMVNICYDSMFPHVIRRQLIDLNRQGIDPDAIINVSNDADSSCVNALDMHFATHVFRAVESRKPYLVASNSGASAWIDCYGQIVRQGEPGSPDCVIANVSRTEEWGVYRNIGDVIPICCALIPFFLIAFSQVKSTATYRE